MTRQEGIKAATKLLGKKMYWRENDNAPRSADERAERQQEWDAVKADHDRLEKARQDRLNALLAADAEYQDIKRQLAEVNETRKRFNGRLGRRIEIGVSWTLDGLGSVGTLKASGDNWSDAIRNLKEKQATPALSRKD